MKYDFDNFLDVRNRDGDQLSARCPFHDDRSPSFSANAESGLWRCFAGCGQGNYNQFLTRVGSDPMAGLRLGSKNKTKKYVRDEGFKTVATYEYLDESGMVRLRVTRQERAGGQKRFFQHHLDAAGLWSKGGTIKSLLPYLIQDWSSSPSNLVYFVEGEKCAEYLSRLGLNATTVAGGANKWRDGYSKYFRGKHVVILPDCDEVGRNFANAVFTALRSQEGVAKVELLHLPELQEGEDVVDWLSQNRTVDDLSDLVKTE